MSDETELEARLRVAGNNMRPGFKNICQPICLEAADELQRLRAERDRLREVNRRLMEAGEAVLSSPTYGNEPSEESVEMLRAALAFDKENQTCRD